MLTGVRWFSILYSNRRYSGYFAFKFSVRDIDRRARRTALLRTQSRCSCPLVLRIVAGAPLIHFFLFVRTLDNALRFHFSSLERVPVVLLGPIAILAGAILRSSVIPIRIHLFSNSCASLSEKFIYPESWINPNMNPNRMDVVPPAVHAGSNFICTSLHLTLTRLFDIHSPAGGKAYIHRLMLSVDNTVSENKNHILLGYFGSLIGRGIVSSAEILFIPVGHTHKRLDRVFSQ